MHARARGHVPYSHVNPPKADRAMEACDSAKWNATASSATAQPNSFSNV